MAKSITVPDLLTDNVSFDDYLLSFNVQRQTDGEAGVVYMGTLTITIKDSLGQPYKTASLTKQIGPSATTALRDYIKTNFLADLRAQEGL